MLLEKLCMMLSEMYVFSKLYCLLVSNYLSCHVIGIHVGLLCVCCVVFVLFDMVYLESQSVPKDSCNMLFSEGTLLD